MTSTAVPDEVAFAEARSDEDFAAFAQVCRAYIDWCRKRYASLPWFVELNRSLRDRLDDSGFHTRIRENVAQLERVGSEIAGLAVLDEPALAAHVPPGLVVSSDPALLGAMRDAVERRPADQESAV